MRSLKLWFVVLAMASTILVLHVRGDVDRVLPSTPLDQLPSTIGTLRAVDIPLSQETLDVLGPGYFLNRVYQPIRNSLTPNSGNTQPIGLYIAYFPTQRTGQSIHSPQNCLPGAGWTFLSKGVTELTDATGKHYRVGEYLITDGTTTQEALYWYQLHGRSIASDYTAKLDTVVDSVRLGRSDEALVRITTPMSQGEDRSAARQRAIGFAEQITPLLPAYIPN